MTGQAGAQRGSLCVGVGSVINNLPMLFSARPIRATPACEKRSDDTKHMLINRRTRHRRGVCAAR